MLNGVNETLQLTTQKVKFLEGKVEEKTSEATMEKQRAVRAEDMLKSEKKEFQRQLQDRIDELRNTHTNEIMQWKQEISKLRKVCKNVNKAMKVGYVKQHLRHKS